MDNGEATSTDPTTNNTTTSSNDSGNGITDTGSYGGFPGGGSYGGFPGGGSYGGFPGGGSYGGFPGGGSYGGFPGGGTSGGTGDGVIQQLEQQAVSLQGQINSTQSDLSNQQAQYSQEQAAINGYNQELAPLQSQISSIQSNISNLNSQINAEDAKYESTVATINNEESQIKVLTKEAHHGNRQAADDLTNYNKFLDKERRELNVEAAALHKTETQEGQAQQSYSAVSAQAAPIQNNLNAASYQASLTNTNIRNDQSTLANDQQALASVDQQIQQLGGSYGGFPGGGSYGGFPGGGSYGGFPGGGSYGGFPGGGSYGGFPGGGSYGGFPGGGSYGGFPVVGTTSGGVTTSTNDPVATTTPAASGSTYKIQPGDTMSSIAQKNGLSLQALENANLDISNPDLIYPGKTLNIPSATANSNLALGGAAGATSDSGMSTQPIVFDGTKRNTVDQTAQNTAPEGGATTEQSKSPEEIINQAGAVTTKAKSSLFGKFKIF